MGDQLILERFVWFDNEVRRQRHPNASTLAEQFEVTPKTAQRNIEYFRERLIAPLEYDFFKKGYYYTDSDFQLPVTRISEEALLALLISRKLITEASAGSLGDQLGEIANKLGSLLAANLPGRAHPEEAFSFRWKSLSPINCQTFKIVTTSLLHGRLLNISYHAPSSPENKPRTIEPHHMVNYMGNWHLIAFCHLRHDWRDFLLSRIQRCQIEETVFTIRHKDEWQPFLHDTFGIYQNKDKFNVILRFTPERAKWVQEEVWHEGQSEITAGDGSLIRTIPASHEAEIMMEIMKHGAQVEVLEPEWLRKRVANEIRAALQNYDLEPRISSS